MIDYSEDLEVLPVKQLLDKKIQVTNTIRLQAFGHSIKMEDKTNQADEIITHFNKWLMPPQPQGYLKSRRYDFF
ncbi:MAG: hypothetical protein ACXWWC_09575 [Chitinophagaceae bacterium]